MEALNVNTLEMPIYCEQFEPQPGEYHYSVIDVIITQAREHGPAAGSVVVCHMKKKDRITTCHSG